MASFESHRSESPNLFNRLNRLVDFQGQMKSTFLFPTIDRYDYESFLRKEEAVVKDLGVHVLDLIFLDEAS